jgi:predicted  nucleic acid-binding Zn-ribbon protein
MDLQRPLPTARAGWRLAFSGAVVFASITAASCNRDAAADTSAAGQIPSTPAAVAQVIDSLETSNDSTKRLLDETRVQLDTALQGIIDISTMLDRLAGQRIQVNTSPVGSAERQTARDNVSALRKRSITQLETVRRRLNELTSSLSGVRDTSRTLGEEVGRLTSLINSMTQRIKSQETRLDELTATVARVSAERDSVVGSNVALAQRADTLLSYADTLMHELETARARDDSVYVLVGDAARLRGLGVAEWTGGILGIGKVLKLRPDFPKGAFVVWSKERTRSLPMPSTDGKYEVLTGQRQSCYSWVADHAPILRIHDPECFWETSRYLVIEERK